MTIRKLITGCVALCLLAAPGALAEGGAQPGAEEAGAAAREAAFAITAQPQDVSARLGEEVSFSIEATGEGLRYQWYCMHAGEDEFVSWSSSKTPHLTVANGHDGLRVYCVVADGDGEELTSEVAALRLDVPLEITKQPQSVSAHVGDRVSFEIEAQGKGLEYQWYSKRFSKGEFNAWVSTRTASLTAGDVHDGLQVYCVVTDADGNSLTSDIAGLDLGIPFELISQPEDVLARLGDRVVFEIEATGKGLQRQWYFKRADMDAYQLWEGKTGSSVALTAEERHDGMLVNCELTDASGRSIESRAAKLTVKDMHLRVVEEAGSESDGYAVRRLEYYDDANEVTETYYNEKGSQVADAQGRYGIVKLTDGEGRLIGLRTLNKSGAVAKDAATGAHGELYEYDANGYLSKRTLVKADGTPVNGTEGWAITAFVNDARGNVLSERYFSAKETAVALDAGYAGIDREFDDRGNAIRVTYVDKKDKPTANADGHYIIERTYDSENRPIAAKYFKSEEKAMKNPLTGAYQERMSYDGQNNVSRVELMNEEGEPMLGADKWASANYRYDGERRIVSERYFDVEGQPCLAAVGSAGIDRVYNADGLVINETYYDETEKAAPNKQGVTSVLREYANGDTPVYEAFVDARSDTELVSSYGYAMVTRQLDDDGRVLRESWFDEKGNAVIPSKQKCATKTWTYDAEGNQISESYFNADGEPMAVGGFASKALSYDEAGNVLSERYFGVDGKLALQKAGYAALSRKLDADGNEVVRTYYDEQGQPVKASDGYASVVYEYDGQGNPVGERWFDESGASMAVNGVYRKRMAYDEKGKLIAESFFDLDGNAVEDSSGSGTITYEYDGKNRLYATHYYGTDGRLKLNADGYATEIQSRDDAGNVVLLAYYGTDGNPIMLPAGYSKLERQYNNNKKVVYTAYEDVNGNPVTQSLGYAILINDYDENNKVVYTAYLDADRKPVCQPTGEAFILNAYNDMGKKLYEAYLGADGSPVNHAKKQYASIRYTYDDAGRATSERYFGKKGDPFVLARGYAGLTKEYLEDGRVVVTTYLDKSDNPMAPHKKMPYVKLRQTYGDNGKVWMEEFLNADGEPTLNASWIAYTITEYDSQGRMIRKTNYDRNGRISSGKGKVAYFLYTYDADGNRTQTKYSPWGYVVR